MNVHKIPSITIHKINSIPKFFLWNASSNTNKKSPINWHYLHLHKNNGGLGIRNLRILNQAYIMKNAWRLVNDKNSLWCKVMKVKYSPNSNLYNIPPPKPYHSTIWKNIYKQVKLIRGKILDPW